MPGFEPGPLQIGYNIFSLQLTEISVVGSTSTSLTEVAEAITITTKVSR